MWSGRYRERRALGWFTGAAGFMAALVLSSSASSAGGTRAAAAGTRGQLEKSYTASVLPFLRSYCVGCHGKNQPKASLDLSGYSTMASVVRDYAHWTLVLQKLEAGEMPPKGSRQPSAAQKLAAVSWIKGMRREIAERSAGDPGPVLARRLSNSEYDYTIRDLTGHDLRPTREFPVDPANQEGFDNTGESLTVSPALMKKYLQAARTVADHLVLKPSGFDFAPHPVLVETDRDKYSILRIVDFYKKQPTDLADYFTAAWRFRHRAALNQSNATLAQTAAQSNVSSKYLETIWATLNAPNEKVGPIARLQSMWNALPAPSAPGASAPQAEIVAMRNYVVTLRKKVAWKFDNLSLRGFSPGGQCFVMWKNRQYASHRRELNPNALQIGGEVKPRTITPTRGNGGATNQQPRVVIDPPDPDLFVPRDEQERTPYLEAFKRFCSVFPDAFFISERGRMFLDDPNDRGRLLSAGLHNAMGYFRDDVPLMELVLDDAGRKQLDRLWLEFDFVAFVPERMHLEFIFYERAESGTIKGQEFDFARSEDKDATSEVKLARLGEVYLSKARQSLSSSGGNPTAIEAIEEYFEFTNDNLRAIEKARKAAEPSHLASLLDFARRAFRRPLNPTERADLSTFYRNLRQKDGLTHEDAMRDCVVSVLMSPNFLYRVDLEADAGTFQPDAALRLATTAEPQSAPRLRPISDYALASRLSYFLWSSMPDEELLARAAAGDLKKPEVLAAQARRMLQNPKVRALALEFGGNWLDFRRFEEHQAVDRERFPSFTDELRQSMFEEPLHFLLDTFQRNRSVLDMLYGSYTFVNAPLARHYGMDAAEVPSSGWVRVDNASRFSRGGLLPMAVFLTKNSPGLRTSPVKRGYWVVKRVLGEHIPAPPAVVPELPKDERKLGDQTLRQVLAQHRENPACSGCHARFDSFGLVFENYGPIGELRARDLGGKPVDTRAPFPGGADRDGLVGLRQFVKERRESDFLDNLCRKLLSYGVGRTLIPSDDPTLAEMRRKLTAGGYRFSTLIDSIVTSRQFRNRRGTTAFARN